MGDETVSESKFFCPSLNALLSEELRLLRGKGMGRVACWGGTGRGHTSLGEPPRVRQNLRACAARVQ
eukprot:427734-Pleurochrysis_carterae.AAC.1